MAQSANNVFSFLLAVIVLFSSLNIEARKIQHFSKFVNQAKQSPISSSKFPLPTRLDTKDNKGHGRYRQIYDKFRNTKSSFDDNESEIPSKEFDEKIKQEFDFPSNYNHHPFVSVPQDFKEKGINDFYYTPNSRMYKTDAKADEKQEAPEDKFVYNNIDEYTNFNQKEKVDNLKGAQGMSDTRTLENGRYSYNPGKEVSYYYSQGTQKEGSNFVDSQGYYRNGGDSKYKFHNIMEEEPLRWDP